MTFSRKAVLLLKKIPKGKVTTYKELAKAAGSPAAARAVGNAMNWNQEPMKYPCYKVVCSDGKIGGYAGGLTKKIRLLRKDSIFVKNGKIKDFEQKIYRFRIKKNR
jgi:methylated-DNA-[protein]-cysteine S-methyltransferase